MANNEIVGNNDAMAEIIERINNLKLGQQGVVVIFAEGANVDVFSRGIHPDSEPMVIEKALAQVIQRGGN